VAPIIPASGSHRPGVVNVRLVAPADVLDAAVASLSDFYGGFWQPGTRKPSRTSDEVLIYGTLIVAVPVPPEGHEHRLPGPPDPWCNGIRIGTTARCGASNRHAPHQEGEQPAWFDHD
jgi:hypothetical protein